MLLEVEGGRYLTQGVLMPKGYTKYLEYVHDSVIDGSYAYWKERSV